jgi:hypothetical protein
MGALTLKEAIGLPIESLQTAQFRHRTAPSWPDRSSPIVIATEPRRDLDVGLAGELSHWERPRSPSSKAERPRGRDADRHRFAGPVARIRGVHPAAQLLAWKLAVERGRPPGSYIRASKVTTRE